MNTKDSVTPCTCFAHDGSGVLKAEVQMPGVDKNDISLEMRRDSFCVTASRKDRDTQYAGCFTLTHEVDMDRTEAKYDNGLLRISAPIRDWDRKKKIAVF